MKKSIATQQDVLNVACNLLQTNAQTTTLEVKEELRKLGFSATQFAVSTLMATLEGQGELTSVDSKKGYRLYSPVTTPIQTVTQPTITTTVNATLKVSGKVGNSWEVNCTNPAVKAVKYFSDSYSRDQVRQMFAKEFKVKFATVRARKAK